MELENLERYPKLGSSALDCARKAQKHAKRSRNEATFGQALVELVQKLSTMVVLPTFLFGNNFVHVKPRITSSIKYLPLGHKADVTDLLKLLKTLFEVGANRSQREEETEEERHLARVSNTLASTQAVLFVKGPTLIILVDKHGLLQNDDPMDRVVLHN